MYENPQQPEGINVSDDNPLRELLVLLLGISIAVVLLVLLLAAAARVAAPHIPFSVEQRLAAVIDLQTITTGEEPIGKADRRQQYVSQLAQRIAATMTLPDEMQIDVTIVQADTVNAYATLGGQIIVYTGLLSRIPTENALAMLLAHEIAHVKLRHPIVAFGTGLTLTIALSAAFGLSDNSAVVGLVEWIGGASMLSYSRQQERDADALAAAAVLASYGHLNGAAGLFEVLAAESANAARTNGPVLEFLSTHPDLQERISILHALAEQRAAAGTTTELPWNQ